MSGRGALFKGRLEKGEQEQPCFCEAGAVAEPVNRGWRGGWGAEQGRREGKEERMRDKNINLELKGVNNIFLIF